MKTRLKKFWMTSFLLTLAPLALAAPAQASVTLQIERVHQASLFAGTDQFFGTDHDFNSPFTIIPVLAFSQDAFQKLSSLPDGKPVQCEVDAVKQPFGTHLYWTIFSVQNCQQ